MVISKLLTGLKSIAISWKTSAASAIVYQAALEGVNFTTIASGFAQLSLRGKIKAVTLAIREQTAAFLATPIGWISVAAISLFAVNKIIEACTTSTEEWKEKLSKTKEELANLKSEAETLSGELETTQQRIAELEGKHNLTFAEAEELELLKQQNAELQRKIDLNDVLQKQARKENNETFVSTMNSDVNSDREYVKDLETGKIRKGDAAYTTGQNSSERLYINQEFEDFKKAQDELVKLEQDYLDGKISKEKFDSSKERIDKEIKETSKYLTGKQGEFAQNAKDIEYIKNPTTEDEKAVNAWLDYINDFNDRLAIALGGDNAKENTISRLLDTSFADIGEKLKKLGEKGDITAEMLNSSEYDAFINKLIELGVITDKTPESLEFVALAFNKVEEAAEGATSAVKSFTDIADSFQDGYDAIVNAQKDIEDQNYLSIDSVKALEKAGLSDYLKETEYGYLLVNDALNTYLEAQGKEYKDALDTAISQASSLATMQDAVAAGYKNDASGLATYLRVLGAANNAMARNEFKNNLISKGFTVTEAHRMWMSSQQRIAADQAQSEYIAAANAIDAAIKNQKTYEMVRKTAQNDTKHSSDSKSGKTEAEKYFEKLKYWRDTNKITELKYYQDLAYYAKQYYKQGKISLDEYASHTEEVYNWLKEQRKKDYEDDIEKLEKKKDAVSEYYDKLREEIENTHDEEDYEKEQSEKRKEIFDLDMQIAELMRDGSEKAKARIAELEEERLKAEEELLDFETDKAREDELSRLEKEQEAEEKKIQAEIDAIDEELQKIDGDIVDGLYDVRKTIVDYAAKQGITLDFAYASGTRSSVGGFGRINEKGIEMISAPDGNGNYIPMLPSSYVFSAKATEFLWKLATEHSLPQAMYNSIARSISAQSPAPSVNIAQPITITMGDIIIKGNANKQTVADIKKEQDNTVRMVLQKIKELQK